MAVLTQDRLSLPVIQRRKDGVEELRLEGFLVLLFFSAVFFKAEFSYGLLGTFFGEMEKCGLTAKRFFFQLVEEMDDAVLAVIALIPQDLVLPHSSDGLRKQGSAFRCDFFR